MQNIHPWSEDKYDFVQTVTETSEEDKENAGTPATKIVENGGTPAIKVVDDDKKTAQVTEKLDNLAVK